MATATISATSGAQLLNEQHFLIDTNVTPAELLARGKSRATPDHQHAGVLHPLEAWALVQAGEAVLVDVRSVEELKADGHIPDAHHVAWQIGPLLLKNVRFLRELEKKASKNAVVILICRSGIRSVAAAEAATKAGFSQIFYVQEGIEGNSTHQQITIGGWRYWDLPVVHD